MMLNMKNRAFLLMCMMAVVFALSSVFVLVCADNAHASKPIKKRVIAKMVFIGDDIVSGQGILNPADGFIAKFKEKVAKDNMLPLEVYDFSRSGETADAVVFRLKDIIATRPDLAVVAIGFNDAMQKTDTDIFYNSMDTILSELYNAGVYIMIVNIPAPMATNDAYEAEFNQVFPKLAERYQAYFVSNIMDGIYGNRHLTQVDMLRPNKEGVDVMLKKFLPPLRKMAKLYEDSILRCRRNVDDPRCAIQATPTTSATTPAQAVTSAPAVTTTVTPAGVAATSTPVPVSTPAPSTGTVVPATQPVTTSAPAPTSAVTPAVTVSPETSAPTK